MDIVCFSHLRWNFVYQRPQHLLSRFAKRGDVHLWEEPLFRASEPPFLEEFATEQGVRVLTPILPVGFDGEAIERAQRELLDQHIQNLAKNKFVSWYYTPMALKFSEHLSPSAVIYDCMDELSGFLGAPPELIDEEKRLFDRADLVFAGGASLYESKRQQHGNVRLHASSLDQKHFESARSAPGDPDDQQSIPHPRIGFFGVLDERLDRDLLRDLARLRPDWHFVLIGPTAKIREEDLPQASNLHYLGRKDYAELPQYLGNWDVAILPFALNAATRFISPTKTPEYLAAGVPVVSTPIQDVVSPYADLGLVRIGRDANEFAAAIEASVQDADENWLKKVDAYLAGTSWDKTFEEMWNEIQHCVASNAIKPSGVQRVSEEMSSV